MRLLYLSLLVLLMGSNSVLGQTLFKETFNNVGGSTSGGAGTYRFPTGWLLRNVDNRTPSGQVSYVNEAWERREDFANNVSDSAAFSTSWYSPEGQADDWMWTPLIGPLPSTSKLRWRGVAYDPDYRDGYEVRVMVGPTAPTGGNGVIGNQVTNSTVVFSTAAENTTWTQREVSLAAYAGQSVYIGFRNNSNNQFLLLIDDVEVNNTPNYDVKVIEAAPASPYSQIPSSQATPLPLSATMRNDGALPLTNLGLKVDVLKDGGVIATLTSVTVATASPGDFFSFSIAGGYTPNAGPGSYQFRYYATLTETDQVPANNAVESITFSVTTDTYARHMGAATNALGIGDGSGQGEMGSLFTISQPTTLRKVLVGFGTTPDPFNTRVRVYTTTGGVPTSGSTKVWESGVVNFSGTTAETVEFTGPLVTLAPGTYLFGLHEIDQTLQVLTHPAIFTPNSQFVRFPAQTGSNWAPVESFGNAFARAFAIAPVLGCPDALTTSLSAASTSFCTQNSLVISASGGTSYAFSGPGLSQSGTSATAIATQVGTFSVVVTYANACTALGTITLTDARPAAPTLVGATGSPLGFTTTASPTPFSLTSLVTATANHTLTFSGAGGPLNPPVANVTTPGVQSFSVTQTNSQGCTSLSTPFNLSVLAPVPPSSQSTCRGNNVVMNISATGTRYQWFRHASMTAPGARLTDVASLYRGTATASLTLVSVQTTGYYSCQVTQANGTVQTFGPYAVVVGLCGGREAAVEPALTVQVRVAPNPLADNTLRATITGAGGQRLTVTLTDQQGRIVQEQQWQQADDEQRIEWNISRQPAGTFLLQAVTDRQRQTVKVVKE